MSEIMEYDLIVVGSGAGGLSTAITAKKRGLNVLVLEKDSVFGGTTAFSGGVLWIPENHHAERQGIQDTREQAVDYLKYETKDFFDEDAVTTFLDNGPKMLKFFEQETSVQFIPTLYPDYHPNFPGGLDIGRSVLAAPFDIRELKNNKQRLRPPLKTITFIGMMFNSSNADLKHFFNATKSVESFGYVVKRLAIHVKELLMYGRGVNVTSGNALAARLAKSAFDLDIPIWTDSPVCELLQNDSKTINGVVVQRNGEQQKIHAKYGVVLASGGFSHDLERLQVLYPHVKRGGEHLSPVTTSSTGDGCRLAEAKGASVHADFEDVAAWMPVSKVPMKDGFGVFPHLLDRYKPGVIGVLKNGQRFTNESNSYHDVGSDLIKACSTLDETAMWLICDKTALDKYGLGYVKPAPMPHGKLIKNGYLIKGNTLEELAEKAGIDAQQFTATVKTYNLDATKGEDPLFNRGSTSFNRYLADPRHQPNPCVAPIMKAPFYAVKVLMGDLGTFGGLKTTTVGEVLNKDNQIIQGLYAVGNDRMSIMGGGYPAAGITLGPIMTFGYVTANYIADHSSEYGGHHGE